MPLTSPPDLAATLDALYARVPLGMRLGLDAMHAACMHSGSPERAFAAVHVAGTNGKGSTSAMVESIAHAAGRRTGLYTSPHLCRFAERIRIDGAPISDEALTQVLGRALELGPELSFFETATLAAFLAFQDHAVDLAVIEVGIGGRLDATSVLPSPLATAITKVAFDHMDRLGDSLALIAHEKASIARRGVPMILGPLGEEARHEAIDVATRAGARIVDADPRDVEGLSLGLLGAHQRANASVAWAIAREIGVGEEARREGLRAVTWPGRFERIDAGARGVWILDGAHNPDGALALRDALGQAPGAIVFGALADKAWPEMLDILSALPCPRVYVRPRGRASADPAALAARAPGVIADSIAGALAEARRLAASAPPGTPVVVAGSLYLVGEARAQLLGLPLDPPVAL